MSWLRDFANARTQMLTLQDQQLGLPASVLAKFPRPSALRVFQLDGERLEQELVKILRAQVGIVFSVFNEGWRFRFQEELDALLTLVLFKFTFWDRNAFYGDQLQNMVYRSEARAAESMRTSFLTRSSTTTPTTAQKLLRLVLTVLLPYVITKLRRRAIQEDWDTRDEGTWQYKVNFALVHAENAWQGAALVNYLVFLRQGVYRTLVDRVLRLRLVNDTQRMNKVVNLSYMNQQLYWSAVFNFLSFIMPLLHLHRLWSFMTSFRSSGGSRVGGDGSGAPGNACAACGMQPVCMPHVGECGHRFCYMCVASRVGGADEDAPGGAFNCPQCGVNLTRIGPAP